MIAKKKEIKSKVEKVLAVLFTAPKRNPLNKYSSIKDTVIAEIMNLRIMRKLKEFVLSKIPI